MLHRQRDYIAKSPGVAWEAHLGGLTFGLIVGLLSYRTLLRNAPCCAC